MLCQPISWVCFILVMGKSMVAGFCCCCSVAKHVQHFGTSFCLESFPASGSFPISQLFASGGQSIGASTSASVLPMNIQGWFPLGPTGLASLQFKGPSRVFFSTTVQKHQLFSAQPSLWSSSYIHLYITAGKMITLIIWTFVGKVLSLLFNMLSRLLNPFFQGTSVF